MELGLIVTQSTRMLLATTLTLLRLIATMLLTASSKRRVNLKDLVILLALPLLLLQTPALLVAFILLALVPLALVHLR